MDTTEHDDHLPGDLLVGASAIRAHLVFLGMPRHIDVYYLRRTGRWPIGNDGQKLIASKRRLNRYTQKLALPEMRRPLRARSKHRRGRFCEPPGPW
jgi:hypothetical protein